MITYRHPTDIVSGGRPRTVEREQRDPELEHYGWVQLDEDGNDVHRDGGPSGKSSAPTGGDGRSDERTDPGSTRHDPEQVANEKPAGRTS